MLRILFFVYLLILLIMSAMPIGSQEISNDLDPGHIIRLDYLIHCTALMVPAWIMLLSIEIKKPVFRHNLITKHIVLCSVIALVSESLQLFVPYRTFNPKDLIANFMGVMLGSLFVWIGSRNRAEG